MTILFVSGINDRSTVGITLDENNQMVNLFDGNCTIYGQVPLKKNVAAYVTLFGKGVKQHQFEFRARPSLIFNQIADADTHRGALERCGELCAQVDSPVINRPEAVLRSTREQVSEALQGITGVKMPRSVRFNPRSPEDVYDHADAQNFGFPFIVRMAGDHGGKSMTRVTSRDDYANLHSYPFDGRDFYLTEYVDCRDKDGFHHRQRLIVIDGKPILRGSLYDKNWKVHGASRSFMMQRESWEHDRIRNSVLETEVIPKWEPAIEEIAGRLKLDIFGIDCSLNRDAEMLIFEANANMNFITNDHPQMNERMDMIKSRIQDMLARHSGEDVI